MKVGIASCFYNHNYGSMLQAYATQEAVKKLGYDAYTINCLEPIHYMTQSKLKYYVHKLKNKDIVKTAYRRRNSRKRMNRNMEVSEGIKVRNECFKAFYKKHINLTSLCKTRQELSHIVEDMSAVVVGSDMLWHPINIEHDYYTLSFVPDEIRKVSYATSIGATKIPGYQKGKMRNFLERFNSISVREKSAVDVIKNLGVNKNVQQVLDPTLLFTGSEWDEIQNAEPIIKDKYIFCYFLGVNEAHREIARQLKEITGYKIVALQHLDEYVEADVQFGDEKPFNVGPAEFLNMIKNASIVCTDSFHGTCFSLLYHKNFFTFNRFLEQNTQSTNTRIDSLLSMVELLDRRIVSMPTHSELKARIDEHIDFEQVDMKLEEQRNRSLSFLEKALG